MATAGCGSTLTAVAGIGAFPAAAHVPAAVVARPVPGDAAAVLAQLPVKGRAPWTGYEREQFGQAWKDVDRNGCDQRNDVLARDLVDETLRGGRCVVLSPARHQRHDATPGRLEGEST
jgi:hypothetical protein